MPYGLKHKYDSIDELAKALNDLYKIPVEKIYLKADFKPTLPISVLDPDLKVAVTPGPTPYFSVKSFKKINPKSLFGITKVFLLEKGVKVNEEEIFDDGMICSFFIASGDPEFGYVTDIEAEFAIERYAKPKTYSKHAGDSKEIDEEKFQEKIEKACSKRFNDAKEALHRSRGEKQL